MAATCLKRSGRAPRWLLLVINLHWVALVRLIIIIKNQCSKVGQFCEGGRWRGSCERMWVMLTRQLSRVVSHFKALVTKRGEREKVAAVMLMILGVGWSPLLGVILLDLSLSSPKATVTSAGILSRWGGWGGEGFPQIKLRRGETDKGVNV